MTDGTDRHIESLIFVQVPRKTFRSQMSLVFEYPLLLNREYAVIAVWVPWSGLVNRPCALFLQDVIYDSTSDSENSGSFRNIRVCLQVFKHCPSSSSGIAPAEFLIVNPTLPISQTESTFHTSSSLVYDFYTKKLFCLLYIFTIPIT